MLWVKIEFRLKFLNHAFLILFVQTLIIHELGLERQRELLGFSLDYKKFNLNLILSYNIYTFRFLCSNYCLVSVLCYDIH